MSQTRICDVADCEDAGLFMVAVWNERMDTLEDSVDVCGAGHAKAQIAVWLKDLADIEEETAQ